MTSNAEEYYVYVYIDPRNFEEFYYGKGKGSRKEAHLNDDSDSEKASRIQAIKKAGLKPIIKVVAKELTEHDALLIEKTLLWKLGRLLSNKSSGYFADKFRPHYTLYQDLAGFDFKNGLYYVNVGEGKHRCWQDCQQYGFISAGQGKIYSEPLKTLNEGDIIAAYLKGHGYVGIGRVEAKAVAVSEFSYQGKSLKEFPLKNINIFENSQNKELSEYLVKIEWLKTFDSTQAKKAIKKDGIFSSQLIKSSLQSQQQTISYLEKEFDVSFTKLLLI